VLHAPRFVDLAPAEVVATLLDEGTYLASERTMYRILADAGQTGERRNQLTHPRPARPELLATRPNELWSWDIERHEVFPDRAVMKGHRRRPVAAGRLKLRAA
jgi:putative transposase